ncbi:MAG TPA: preprotein translocase subunit SecG [Candidatus Tumulicola sp.]
MISLFLAAASAAPLTKTPPVSVPVLPPGAIPQPPVVVPHTAIALHAPWFTHGIAGIFVISAVLLVGLLAIQTTKQEGLSGSIGGQVQSAYRGRLGADEQLKRATGFIAVMFVVSAFILALTGI